MDGGSGGAEGSDFLNKESKTYFKFFWEGEGARVSDFFLQRIQIQKKKLFSFLFGGRERGS